MQRAEPHGKALLHLRRVTSGLRAKSLRKMLYFVADCPGKRLRDKTTNSLRIM